CANNGGYFAWNTTAALLNAQTFTQNQIACTGGGFAGMYASGYGNTASSLTGCSTSLSGGQRTVTFTVKPNANFPTFSDNDINMYVQDACGNTSSWLNYDLNFASNFAQTTNYTATTATAATLSNPAAVSSLGMTMPAGLGNGQIAGANNNSPA